MDKLNRREFVAAAGALAGYSVFVNATGLQPIRAAGAQEVGSLPDSKWPGQVRVHSATIAAEPNMRVIELESDVLVAGGGMSGVCAAIAAARHGATVVLVQDRSRLGGNASSEIRMHIVGADMHGSRPGWREGGLIEELRLEDAVRNPHRAHELFDLMLYDKCVSEPNLKLLLDTAVFAADVEEDRISAVMARCDKTETLYRIRAHTYCDCTGDARLGLESGAEFRIGREGQVEFGESLAPEEPDRLTQGSSILFTARRHDSPIPFTPPGWARKITAEQLRFRPVGSGSYEYGYWWIELGGRYDTIRDNERLRFELLSIVLGVWDWIKNSGQRPDSAKWALQTVGMIPGKRESRRLVGDLIQSQHELEGAWRTRDDGVSIGGWGFDDHPPGGFDAPEKRPYNSVRMEEPYNISFEALYSRNLANLMMAGRNISNSHVAFTSTRVMATCACMGQAVGAAAALCKRYGLQPRAFRRQHMKELQQVLLLDDQTIREVRNEDADDLARKATVIASAVHEDALPEHVIDGYVRDTPGEWKHRWAAEMSDGGVWIELQWEGPQRISRVQITFDSGFHRELTLSASDGVTRRVIRGPQPETVKSYTLTARTPDRSSITLAEVRDNYQRLRRHAFEPRDLSALRLHVDSTNGSEHARVFEIRCYED